MGWNAKWDCDFVGFGSKAIESPKNLKLTDLMIDDGEINGGSFNISDWPHVSSAKSSISSSTDSSIKDGFQPPNFKLVSFERFSGNCSKKIEVSRTSPPMGASIGSVEPLIGLKLGKRTYFENSGAVGNIKSISSLKKSKPKLSGKNPVMPRCLVEGCNVDISKAKEYHRKHRVCERHSKCTKVIIGGLERRFCQQCSRFHNLSEFDEKKRSCRRRLSDHNARRRKPQQETIQFNSTRLSSPFYGGRQETSFLLNNYPLIQSKTPMANSKWDSTCNAKFTLTNGLPLKSNGDVGITKEHLHISGVERPNAIDMHADATNGCFSTKSCVPDVWNPGSKGSSMISSHLDATPAYGRALSLLSTNSCGPHSSIHHPAVTHPTVRAIPEGVPLSSDFWLTAPHSSQPLPTNANFQESRLLKSPFEADFYSNILN